MLIKDTFVMYKGYRELLCELSNEDMGEIFRAILDYANGITPKLDKRSQNYAYFNGIRLQIDNNEKKWLAKCEQNRQNVNKRWEKTNGITNNTIEYEKNECIHNDNDIVNDNENENENDTGTGCDNDCSSLSLEEEEKKDIEREKQNNTLSDAQASTNLNAIELDRFNYFKEVAENVHITIPQYKSLKLHLKKKFNKEHTQATDAEIIEGIGIVMLELDGNIEKGQENKYDESEPKKHVELLHKYINQKFTKSYQNYLNLKTPFIEEIRDFMRCIDEPDD